MTLQLIPGMLNDAHIRAIRWPIELLWEVFVDELPGMLGCVFRIVVLLENDSTRAQPLISKGSQEGLL